MMAQGVTLRTSFQGCQHAAHYSLAHLFVQESLCCVGLCRTFGSCANTAPRPMLQCASSDHFSVFTAYSCVQGTACC